MESEFSPVALVACEVCLSHGADMEASKRGPLVWRFAFSPQVWALHVVFPETSPEIRWVSSTSEFIDLDPPAVVSKEGKHTHTHADTHRHTHVHKCTQAFTSIGTPLPPKRPSLVSSLVHSDEIQNANFMSRRDPGEGRPGDAMAGTAA